MLAVFNIAPTGVNVQPQGLNIGPPLTVIGPYNTTVAGQVTFTSMEKSYVDATSKGGYASPVEVNTAQTPSCSNHMLVQAYSTKNPQVLIVVQSVLVHLKPAHSLEGDTILEALAKRAFHACGGLT